MIRLTSKSLMAAALSVAATMIATSASANPHVLCHNIGGPRDLGANCEATGNCTFILPGGGLVTFSGDEFLGILIGAGDNAIAAHLAHGDGYAFMTYNPPLHLASVVGPHQESNVECIARRAIPQPPEPGN